MHFLALMLLCSDPGIKPKALPPISISFNAESEYFDPEYFSVVNNGELFLVNNYHQLLAFDSNGGEPIFELTPEQDGENPYIIANYAHFNWNEYHLLVLNLREDNKPNSELDFTPRIYIYDLDLLKDHVDGFLGFGIDPRREDPKSAFFRQVLAAGDKLFVNLWDYSFAGKDRAPLLSEVVLEPVDGGFEFRLVGQPFDEMRRAFNPIGENMKRRFISPDPNASAILVSHQLQKDLWIYDNNSGKRQVVNDLRRLDIDNFVVPYARQGSQPWDKWITSFSQMTGLYTLGQNLLIGYISPNPEHDFYAAEFNAKSKPDVPRHVLHLQLIANGTRKAQPSLTIPGGFLMGVNYSEKQAYVFQENKTQDGYEILRLQL